MSSYLEDMQAAIQATGYFQDVAIRTDPGIAVTRGNALPAAYLIPSEEHSSGNNLVNGVAQQVLLIVDVFVAVADVSGSDTNTAIPDMETAKRHVRRALIGKTFGNSDPFYSGFGLVEYHGGYTDGYDNGVFWYVSRFRVATQYRGIQ